MALQSAKMELHSKDDKYEQHPLEAYKSPLPYLNIHRHSERIESHTVYLETPVKENDSKASQTFVDTESLMSVYGMKAEQKFVNTLENLIYRVVSQPN